MILIIDVTDNLNYKETKEQTMLLQMVNASVSHELRNPLNSIKAQNILKKEMYENLKSQINQPVVNKD